VDGVGIVRDADTVASQLLAESYRPGTSHRRGLLQRSNPFRQLLRAEDGGPPEPLALRAIERGEDLTPPAVENGQRRAPALLPEAAAERVERADATRRQPEADREAAGGRDPDPDPGEGARAEADREQVDPLPAAGGGSRLLDLRQEPGRVPGPPLRG